MDDAKLEHVLEFPLGSLEPIRCEASGSGRDGGQMVLMWWVTLCRTIVSGDVT